MKTIILFAILLSAVCLSCTHNRQQFKAEATPDEDLTITGVNDTVADIQVTSADNDTIIYDTPECFLWYVEDLPDKYKNKTVSMWVEQSVYRENTQAINVFVANPTNVPLLFGRKWDMQVWNGSKWVSPKAKFSPFIWKDDEIIMPKGMMLHCFCFPVGRYYHLPKGKYRICKSFHVKREKIELSAEFEIK